MQPGGGVLIGSYGTTATAALPPLAPLTFESQAAVAALYSYAFGLKSHTISAYIARLDLAASLEPALPIGLTVGSLTEAATAGVKRFGGVPVDGTTIPTTSMNGVPKMSVHIPPMYEAKAINIGANTWCVSWMGNLVLTGASSSNARTAAKHLNRYLRYQQTVAEIDHGQFNDSLAKFWSVCTEAALGFKPPANVV